MGMKTSTEELVAEWKRQYERTTGYNDLVVTKISGASYSVYNPRSFITSVYRRSDFLDAIERRKARPDFVK